MDEDGETIPDPHAWHNLANTELYVNNITKALIAADPANKADYQRNSQTYLKEIYACSPKPRPSSARCHRATARSSPPTTPSVIWARPTASTSWRRKACPPNANHRPPKSLR
jgi:hypothetical protein